MKESDTVRVKSQCAAEGSIGVLTKLGADGWCVVKLPGHKPMAFFITELEKVDDPS